MSRSEVRQNAQQRWTFRVAGGTLVALLAGGGWQLFNLGSATTPNVPDLLVELPSGTPGVGSHAPAEPGQAPQAPGPEHGAPATPHAVVPVKTAVPAAPPVIPDGREMAPEEKPASNTTTTTLRLRYAHDAVFTTPTGQRFLVRFTPFHEEPRYGVRATIHPRVSGGWSAIPASTVELFEWQPLIDGRRKYEPSRSVETLVFPDRSSLGWSYGGNDRGWFYNGQNRFQVVELEAPVAGDVSF